MILQRRGKHRGHDGNVARGFQGQRQGDLSMQSRLATNQLVDGLLGGDFLVGAKGRRPHTELAHEQGAVGDQHIAPVVEHRHSEDLRGLMHREGEGVVVEGVRVLVGGHTDPVLPVVDDHHGTALGLARAAHEVAVLHPDLQLRDWGGGQVRIVLVVKPHGELQAAGAFPPRAQVPLALQIVDPFLVEGLLVLLLHLRRSGFRGGGNDGRHQLPKARIHEGVHERILHLQRVPHGRHVRFGDWLVVAGDVLERDPHGGDDVVLRQVRIPTLDLDVVLLHALGDGRAVLDVAWVDHPHYGIFVPDGHQRLFDGLAFPFVYACVDDDEGVTGARNVHSRAHALQELDVQILQGRNLPVGGLRPAGRFLVFHVLCGRLRLLLSGTVSLLLGGLGGLGLVGAGGVALCLLDGWRFSQLGVQLGGGEVLRALLGGVGRLLRTRWQSSLRRRFLGFFRVLLLSPLRARLRARRCGRQRFGIAAATHPQTKW
mmetsp:Transcript_141750/g.247095  ORF Transcript_141750/g.247095 Transcript_141750/m.247095 type:complete len:485 (+) Transcript_141750:1902-3356(+)